jgi:hypothetical protein
LRWAVKNPQSKFCSYFLVLWPHSIFLFALLMVPHQCVNSMHFLFYLSFCLVGEICIYKNLKRTLFWQQILDCSTEGINFALIIIHIGSCVFFPGLARWDWDLPTYASCVVGVLCDCELPHLICLLRWNTSNFLLPVGLKLQSPWFLPP